MSSGTCPRRTPPTTMRAERHAAQEVSEEEQQHQRVVKLVQQGDVSKACKHLHSHGVDMSEEAAQRGA